MLREMLDEEEKTREILERVQKHEHPSSSSVTLPASLPPKKELGMAELQLAHEFYHCSLVSLA